MQRLKPVIRGGPLRAFAVGLLVSALAIPAQANLLSNGGFEDGDTGGINDTGNPTDWFGFGPQSGWHHDDAGKTIDTKAIKFWWDDAGVWQDVSIAGGVELAYSVMTLNHTDDMLTGWNGQLIAEFYNSSVGTDPGDKLLEVTVDKFYSASDPTNTWVELSGNVTAPATADIARMILKIGDWTSEGVGGSLNFDNASIEVVPEPSALCCLLTVGLLAARRRR